MFLIKKKQDLAATQQIYKLCNVLYLEPDVLSLSRVEGLEAEEAAVE